MDILRIDPSDRRQVGEFVDLPSRLYRDVPQWVPPLAGDERRRLDLRRNPYYRHSAAAFFLARQGGQAVGRLAALDNRRYNEHNGARTAFFCLFECRDDPAAARGLFEAAFAWSLGRGLDAMLGPKGFTALDGLGLLVKGFEHRPAFGLPYNPSYYAGLVEAQGFEKHNDIVSGYLDPRSDCPPRIHDLAERIRARRGLHIARFATRRQLKTAVSHLQELYNGSLEDTPDGTPLDAAEVKALADQMLWFADPNLIKIVMKGDRPVGFLLAYPDVSEAVQKTKGRLLPFGWLRLLYALRTTDWINVNGAGMLAGYRGLGGTAILYSEMFKSVSENPRYRHAEIVQIGLENDRMQRDLENFGVDFYKLHRIYRRPL